MILTYNLLYNNKYELFYIILLLLLLLNRNLLMSQLQIVSILFVQLIVHCNESEVAVLSIEPSTRRLIEPSKQVPAHNMRRCRRFNNIVMSFFAPAAVRRECGEACRLNFFLTFTFYAEPELRN